MKTICEVQVCMTLLVHTVFNIVYKRTLDMVPKISVNGTPDPYGINSICRSIGVARHK